MSAREFAEWQAFYEIEPFGDFRMDLRSGTAMAPLMNLLIALATKQYGKLSSSDYVMEFGKGGGERKQTAAEMKQIFVDLTKAMGGKIGVRKRGKRGRRH